MRCIAFLITPLLLLVGCQAQHAARPALINHPVFFELNNPDDAPELIADCDAMVAEVSEVISYYAGAHFETGRANVKTDYDVGFYVGFSSAEDYQTYVQHEAHQALVRKWGPRCVRIDVYDVLDETE